MSEPFVGEIRMFAGNFAPRGWAFCDGQLLAVSQNDALFSLLGTLYGGDGVSTFGLPDLRGRVPVHAGQGPGLSSRPLGASFGVERVTLSGDQIPGHEHRPSGTDAAASSRFPAGNVWAEAPNAVYRQDTPDQAMAAGLVTETGGNQPHNNMMPFLGVHFIIALFGIYPSRH
ncbi:MAG: phage tail protein [Alcanivorax sp.]|nr:phage tail protein [Alcanivorax sp.]